MGLVINSGDTAWMLISTALVIFMTIPGVAMFYGGLIRRENVLNTMFLSFVTFAIVSILWFIWIRFGVWYEYKWIYWNTN